MLPTHRNYTDPEGGKGNVNGHIIRFREDGDTTTALSFTWDIYLFGAEAKWRATLTYLV